MPEKDLYKPMMEYLRTYCKPRGWKVWRNNTGRRGYVKFGKDGSPDFEMLTKPFACYYGIEVKTPEQLKKPNQGLSEKQIEWRDDVTDIGAGHFIVASLEMLKLVVEMEIQAQVDDLQELYRDTMSESNFLAIGCLYRWPEFQ